MFNFRPSVGTVKGWDETKNFLIDVVDFLALFTLHCSQQVSKHSSNHPGGFLQRSPMHPFLSPEISVPCSEKTDQLWCSVALRATTEAPEGPRDACTPPVCIYTMRPFTLGGTGDCSRDPWAPCLWPSAEPNSRSNMHEKQGRSTVHEIPLNCD